MGGLGYEPAFGAPDLAPSAQKLYIKSQQTIGDHIALTLTGELAGAPPWVAGIRRA